MRRVLALAVISLVAVSCSGDAGSDVASTTTAAPASPSSTTAATLSTTTSEAPPPAPYVPGDTWTTVDAEAAGFNPDLLAAAVAEADAYDSNCFAVVRGGELVVERYWNDTDALSDHEVFSTTKSVTAAMIGAAETAGFLDIDQPASDFITDWQSTASAEVTIRQILQNTSGRYYDPVPDLFELGGKPDMTAYAVGLEQQLDPDAAWSYNQSAIQTLDDVLEVATGMDPAAFAEAYLFEPLGMDVEFRRDAAGNIPLFAGLQAGCLDLARFGLFSARMGQWGDEEVVSESFMTDATSGRTDLNRAYGFLYWVNAEDNWDHTDPRRDRSEWFWPDLPLDAFGAMGLGDQFVLVLPSIDTVVVRIGPPSGTQTYDGPFANGLGAMVLAAATR